MRPRRILVIDEQQESRCAISRRISSWGHQVDMAEDGGTAVKFIQQTTPDLILLDMRLPGSQRSKVLREANNGHGAIPVVMLTKDASLKDVIGAMCAGAYHFLKAPIDDNLLRATLVWALGPRQFRREIRRSIWN